MRETTYRAMFIFNIAEAYRRLMDLSQRAVDEQNLQHRVRPEDLVEAFFHHVLEHWHALVVQPTQSCWAKQFISSEMYNDEYLQKSLYNLFDEALRPSTHPCFHESARLTVTYNELTLLYVVPYRNHSPT